MYSTDPTPTEMLVELRRLHLAGLVALIAPIVLAAKALLKTRVTAPSRLP